MSIARNILATVAVTTAVTGTLAGASHASVPPSTGASAAVDRLPITASAAFVDKAVEHGKILLSFVKDGGGPKWVQFRKGKMVDSSTTRPGTNVLAAFNRNLLA